MLKYFPPVEFAFAYGSSVLPQHGHIASMKDVIFVVENPHEWHSSNKAANPSHYSTFTSLQSIDKLQHSGAGVFFLPFVRIQRQLYKYGVISSARLLQDLNDWDSLYVAGRLHKPVVPLKEPPSFFQEALTANLNAAVAAAVLLLPKQFQETELFQIVCHLSYDGDVRNLFAERKDKVEIIVAGNQHLFRGYYQQSLRLCGVSPVAGNTVLDLLSLLPSSVINSLQLLAHVNSLAELAECKRLSTLLRQVLKQRVRRSSWQQAIKGFHTAGPVHSLMYWYSQETVAVFVTEIESLGGKVAFISTPSLYFSLQNQEVQQNAKLFEFDKSFEKYPAFVFYDFHHPEDLPESLHHSFDIVVADPPFITDEVWRLYAAAITTLLIESNEEKAGGKIIVSTIGENAALLKELLGVKPVKFQPSIPHLVYQYTLFTNYDSIEFNQINTQIQ